MQQMREQRELGGEEGELEVEWGEGEVVGAGCAGFRCPTLTGRATSVRTGYGTREGGHTPHRGRLANKDKEEDEEKWQQVDVYKES